MTNLHEPNFIEITDWQTVRDEVYNKNKPLAIIIDEFNPNANYPLIRVRYPFGAKIRHNGKLHLPVNASVCRDVANHPEKFLQKHLSYSTSPIGFILDKAVEVYVEMPEGRVVTFKLFKPGVCFGVWEVMTSSPIMLRQGWDWSISSGARNLFMLPKISDAASHSRLQHDYHIKAHLPNSVFEQHKIFKEITDSKQSNTNWHTEILFFTSKWLEDHPKNIGWVKLKEYWAREAWQQMLYWSNKVYLDYSWEKFTSEMLYRKIALKHFSLDTLRHLISIGCGTIPGFRLADRDNSVAPITQIQEAYLKSYDLKNYAPLIMHADMFAPPYDIRNLYYSLQAPTLPANPPEWKEMPSAMKSLRDLKIYVDVFTEIFGSWNKISTGSTLDFIENIRFSYFHNDKDKYNIVQSIEKLYQSDKSFEKQLKCFPGKIFAEASSFFRGCVRIELIP